MNQNRWLGLLLFVVVCLLCVAPAFAAVTPEAVKQWWNPYAALGLMLFGTAVKFWPPLAKVHNEAIGWLNAVLYILVSLGASGVVHASGVGAVVGGATVDFADTIVRGVVHSASAMALWETFGRYFLQRVLRMKKAVPAPAIP